MPEYYRSKGRRLTNIHILNYRYAEPDYLGPSGPWQYTRPIALLVNDVTGSAADLFACELRSAGRVLTVGSTTHG
jgi:C-terminal processing protease CtpA/Prc